MGGCTSQLMDQNQDGLGLRQILLRLREVEPQYPQQMLFGLQNFGLELVVIYMVAGVLLIEYEGWRAYLSV